MGAGYQVVLSDIGQAATEFGTESTAVGALRPTLSPAPVSTGDSGLDATLRAVLDTLGVLGTSISGKLAEHGKKLTTCHDNYRKNDADVVELFGTMLSALGKG